MSIKNPREMKYQMPVMRVATDQKVVYGLSPIKPETTIEMRYAPSAMNKGDLTNDTELFFIHSHTANPIPINAEKTTRFNERVDVPL